MNRKFIFSIVGRILEILGLALLLPMAVSLIYREASAFSFAITASISFISGFVIRLFCKSPSNIIYAKEGFLIVALSWLTASVVGALPFVISGEVTSYVDALFETASGFSTTGASVINNIEGLSHGMLFWRGFTHWIGGMGFLVFILAFVGGISDRSIHILRAEMPGPIIGKLMPRAKDTSKFLYITYIILTLLETILLAAGDMSLFDSVIHALSTAGTGGFSTRADSLASFSPYSQWVITCFMLIFGINFNLFYLATIRRFKAVIKSTELWIYLLIIVLSSGIIFFNIRSLFPDAEQTLRASAFQVCSILSTTGFTTHNFDAWPTLSRSIIAVLLFFGGCAGSTAGGLKISRIVIIFKMIGRELKSMIHPRSVNSVKFEGKELSMQTQRGVSMYLATYMVCIFIFFLLLSFEPFTFETNFTAAVTCFNNVGPGLGGIGPLYNFSQYSDFSKIVLTFAMLMGRLEIFPMLIAIFPSTWTKK